MSKTQRRKDAKTQTGSENLLASSRLGVSALNYSEVETESVLSRLPWLLAMESVLLVILCYPMRLSAVWLEPMIRDWAAARDRGSAWGNFCLEQFESFLSFYHSPLILKGALAAVCAAGMFATLATIRVLKPILGDDPPQPSRERERATDNGNNAHWTLPYGRGSENRWAFGAWLLFILWSAASALWSPTPALSLEGLAWTVIHGGLGYVLLRRGFSEAEVRQFAALMMAMGFVVCTISLCEVTEIGNGLIFNFLYKFEDPERRNIYGSLIGHNTGVASFLMMTAFPSLAFAIDAPRLWQRWLSGAYLALALLTALLVQSRTVWIVGTILGLAFIRVALKQRGGAWPKRIVLAVVVVLGLGLASQMIASRWNPFFVKENALLRRFRDLTPARLQEEARLRLFVCSLPLTVDRPLIGHGLYSFQYVYPKAQGDYTAKHPDTKLGLTTKRSHMAHNEYLQTVIEEGWIGLLLMVAALGEVASRGKKIGSVLEGRQKLLHTAFGFSALALGLHAFVDFPFHIPQLAVTWLFCVAAYGAYQPNRDLCRSALQNRRVADNSVGAGDPTYPAPPQFRSGHVARLVVAWCFILAVPFVSFPFARAVQADINYTYGQAVIELLRHDVQLPAGRGMEPEIRERYFREAATHLSRTLVSQPSHDTARFLFGEMSYIRGIYLGREEARLPAGAPKFYTPAIASLLQAVEQIRLSQASLRYHNSFYTLALCYGMLVDMTRNPSEKKEYEEQYEANLNATLYYAPALAQAAVLLDRVCSSRPSSDPQRLVSLRRLIQKYDPHLFLHFYVFEYNRRLAGRDYERAAEGAENLLRVDPDNPDYLIFAIDAQTWAGNHARVLELVPHLQALKVDPKAYAIHPYWSSMGGLFEQVIRKNWLEALKALDHHGPGEPRQQIVLSTIEEYARQQTGLQGLPSRYPKPETMTQEQWDRTLAEGKGAVLFHILNDPQTAKGAFEARLKMAGQPPGAGFWIEYGYLAREMKDDSLLRACLEQVRVREPNHPAIAALNRGLPENNAATETR